MDADCKTFHNWNIMKAATITHVFCAIVLQLGIISLLTTNTVLGFQIDLIQPVRIHNQRHKYPDHYYHPQFRIIDTTTTTTSSTRRYHGSISNDPNDNVYSNDNNANDESLKRHFQSSSSFESQRRNLLRQMVTVVSFMVADRPSANAFANKISNQYDDRPKRRGPMPPDLGIRPRTNNDGDESTGLKYCKDAPNCFSSSIPVDDDPNHSIPAWIYPNDKDLFMAMQDIREVIANYPPGQANIDGGGFEIKTYDPKSGYIYVQFESLKNGYIDDFEAAYIPPAASNDNDDSSNSSSSGSIDHTIQVRSSSRVGYLDYGVNAKRINYIARELRTKYGWTAEGVLPTTHGRYFIENEISP